MITPRPSWSASQMSGIRIGINPLTWTNDDMPELGGETPLEVCLSEARQAGYEGVELGNKFPRDPAILAPILARHDLDLVSGWYSASLLERSVKDEIAALEPHLKLLESLGSKVLVFAETTNAVHCDRKRPLSKRPRLDAARWTSFARAVTEVAEHTRKRGVRLAYHHHMGTVVETSEEIDRLMQLTGDAVGLLLDTGHLTYAGGKPIETARKHGKRIVHVHAKDIRAPILTSVLKRDLPFLEAVLEGVFTVPGDGSVDYPGVFRALKEAGYKGWIVVEAEQDPSKAHPLTYAKMGFKNVTHTAEQARLLLRS